MVSSTTEIYTLSLHDALPISTSSRLAEFWNIQCLPSSFAATRSTVLFTPNGLKSTVERVAAKLERSEEHTSELQSHVNLVCRLLLEKKKKKTETTREYITHIT